VKPVADQKSIRCKGPASIQVVTTRQVVEKCLHLLLQSYQKFQVLVCAGVCVFADYESGRVEVGGSSLFICLLPSDGMRGSGLGSLVQRYKATR
jgi:hypothetical protein